MGNENSTPIKKIPETIIKPVPKKKTHVPKDNRNHNLQAQLESVPEAPPSFDYYQQQSYDPYSNQPTSAVPGQRSLSSANSDPTTEQISSASNRITADSFEKAPMIQLNYVVKQSDNTSINTYGPGNITIMHRASSQSVPHGDRWYDKDYNKNVKPLVTKYV